MMKTFFGIVVGLMLLFSNTMVQAVPPHKKTVPVFTVAVTIQNSSKTQSLNLQYQPSTLGGIPTPSTPSLTSVSASSSASVNISMLPAGYYLTASYDSNNYCKFRFFAHQHGFRGAERAYQQGSGMRCNISVSGKNSVTIRMTKPPQTINFTIKNDSSFPLKYHSTTSSLAGSLHTIPANFSVNLTHTLNTPDSVFNVSYGLTKYNFCTFSYQSSTGVATASSTGLVITCRIGSNNTINTMHVNISPNYPNYHPGAKCNQSGHWSYRFPDTNTKMQCSNLECEATFLTGQQQPSFVCSNYSKYRNSFNNQLRGATITIYTDDDSYATNSFIYCDAKNTLGPIGNYIRITNLPHDSMKRECAYLVSQDPHLNFNYGN